MASMVHPWVLFSSDQATLAIPPHELRRRLNAEVFDRVRRFGWLPLAVAVERMVSCWYWLPPESAWWISLNWLGVACSILALMIHAHLFQEGTRNADIWIAGTVAIALIGFSVNSLGYRTMYPVESTAFVLLTGSLTMFSPWLMFADSCVALICRIVIATNLGDDYSITYLIIRFSLFAPIFMAITHGRRRFRSQFENLAWLDQIRGKELAQLVVQMSHEVEDRLAVEKELRKKEREFRGLSRKLLTLQETERARISRELHDQLGQDFTAVRFSLELLRRKLAPAVDESIDETIQLVNQSIDHVRGLAMELRPSLLDHLGLEAALRWNADRIRSHSPVAVTFESNNHGPRFSPSIEAASFRIAQEAMTNAVRHAQARSIVIRHENTANDLTVSVDDDGGGFDVPARIQDASPSSGLGLLGMRERAEDNGGELTIESKPGHGTKVQVVFHRSKNGQLNESGAA